MKRFSVILIIFVLLGTAAGADDNKTSRNFSPKPPEERPLLGFVPETFSPVIGLTASAVITLSGAALTALSIQGTLEELMAEPKSIEVQLGILKTGASLAGTALFAVITDFFLDRILNTRDKPAE